MHGAKAFANCEIPDCESCAKFVEKYPLRQKRGNFSYYVSPQRIQRVRSKA